MTDPFASREEIELRAAPVRAGIATTTAVDSWFIGHNRTQPGPRPPRDTHGVERAE
ncbi:hypothetical protein [Sphaerisporangium album]|uniref:hypothetical protein n=1 Tax=Sphaerisporangium album TaxID=509200 RepID=UPI0015F0C244|nr:hypothetical protein [Sphaerisporangium album]